MISPDFERICVIGLGLIGGSFALNVRRYEQQNSTSRRQLAGVEISEANRTLAEKSGAFDLVAHSIEDINLRDCGLVILCTPVAATLDLLSKTSTLMRDGAVLTDVAGVKLCVCDRAKREVREGIKFVGAHPMFGGEQGGFAHARPDMWFGGNVAVCTDNTENQALQSIVDLHGSLGAQVVVTNADEHDLVMAIVSHVPFLVAHAFERLGLKYGPRVQQLAGRTFADITRVAQFAFEIQGEVTRRNPYVDTIAKQLIEDIEQMRRDLKGRS